jgi:coenzyme F420 hydrogenase subunit beta
MDSGKRYVFIGTPCQIAGIRNLQKYKPSSMQTFPFLLTNFCGGYRDYRDLDHLIIAKAAMSPKDVTYFQHRGDGQPGFLKVENKATTFKYPYPAYGKYSVVPKHKRCELCIDATGELADISFGDAWLPKFENSDKAWSIMLIRNPLLSNIIKQMSDDSLINIEDIKAEEVIKSQKNNLTSKLLRQKKRYLVHKLLFRKIPVWDKKLESGEGSLFNELRILVSKQYLELKYRIKNVLPKKS